MTAQKERNDEGRLFLVVQVDCKRRQQGYLSVLVKASTFYTTIFKIHRSSSKIITPLELIVCYRSNFLFIVDSFFINITMPPFNTKHLLCEFTAWSLRVTSKVVPPKEKPVPKDPFFFGFAVRVDLVDEKKQNTIWFKKIPT